MADRRVIRDGALPAILLSLAMGLAFAWVAQRHWLAALVLSIVAAIAGGAVVLPESAAVPVASGAALATILCACLVYRARPIAGVVALALAIGAGLAIGALTALTGEPRIVLAPLCAVIVLPAAWFVARDRPIVVKVLASWLLAVSVLSAGLNTVKHPNAGSDHLD